MHDIVNPENGVLFLPDGWLFKITFFMCLETGAAAGAVTKNRCLGNSW